MHKLCLPAFALALAVPRLAGAAEPAAAATVSASASAKITISDQDALNDDILSVIDLPLAAADAREAGVDETELKSALTTTREAGLPASEATEIVSVEAEQTRARGAKKGFGHWVRQQVAAGLRGKKLADKIKARKEDTKEVDEKTAADLQTKLTAQAEVNRAWRQKWLEKRKELIAKGKKPVLVHKDRHDRFKAKIDAAQDRVDDKQAKIDDKQGDTAAKLKALEAKLAAASDADKPALEAEKKRLEKQLGKLEKHEDKLEKHEDKLEKREDKLDKIDDKKAPNGGKPIPRPGPPDKGSEPGKGVGKAGDKKAPDTKAGGAGAAQ